MHSDFSLNSRHAGKKIKIAKPRFELVTDGSTRVCCTHADKARVKCASITSRRHVEAGSYTRECWEQHVGEGAFNFSNIRKYRFEDCGKVQSF